jgi:hypothetical protein
LGAVFLFLYIATVGLSLESANVVGYASSATKNGFKAMGASFAPVGETMNLQDLKVTGYNREEGFSGAFEIQMLDSIGRTDKSYTWFDIPADPEDPDSVAFYGWYDGDFNLVENETINPCDGLWVSTDSDTYGLQSAGQVITTPTSKTLGSDGAFVMVANPLPVGIDLQEITVGGYDVEAPFEGSIEVQFLDTIGRTLTSYTWFDLPADPEEPDSVAFYGWYDGDFNLAEKVTIEAGSALWTSSDSSTYSLVFPGVTL